MKRWKCTNCARLYSLVDGDRDIRTCRRCGHVVVRIDPEVAYDSGCDGPDDVLHKAPRAWLWGRARA